MLGKVVCLSFLHWQDREVGGNAKGSERKVLDLQWYRNKTNSCPSVLFNSGYISISYIPSGPCPLCRAMPYHAMPCPAMLCDAMQGKKKTKTRNQNHDHHTPSRETHTHTDDVWLWKTL